jgi:hypothetical protein
VSKTKIKPLKTAQARLHYVANLIEMRPDEWRQDRWNAYVEDDEKYDNPLFVADKRSCGAFGCAAGHAVSVTPKSLLGDVGRDWLTAGAVAFGLGKDASSAVPLFAASFGVGDPPFANDKVRAKRMIKCLRWLASLSDEDRRQVPAWAVEAFSNGSASADELEPGKLP